MTGTVVLAAAIGIMYLASPVFIPIAVAVFLTFVLTPLVRVLEKLKLGRLGSVAIVIILLPLLAAGMGTVLIAQVQEFAQELPTYSENIKTKLHFVLDLNDNSISRPWRRFIEDVSEAWQPRGGDDNATLKSKTASNPDPQSSKPIPVTVRTDSTAWLTHLSGSLFSFLAQCAFAGVLVVFMLCKREDLRNRFIWLVGHGRLTVTTRAVDDATQRLTRYLFTQFTINVVFGVVVSIGLALIGVQHALLWGFLAGVLRYVPYVGAPVAALLPISLSLIQFPGWIPPLLVIGLFTLLEVVTSQVIEPLLFGRSGGVSEVMLLIAAALAAYLWGPVGLILAMPLTVCLVVLGEYVPALEFVAVLLGDRPALSPQVTLYQRLAAHDLDEASHITLAFAEKHQDQVYDDLLLPVLSQARLDYEADNLSQPDLEFLVQGIREIMEDFKDRSTEDSGEKTVSPGGRGRVLGIPARDPLDQLALEMFAAILDPAKWQLEIAPASLLASELIAFVVEQAPAIICIGTVAPGGLAHTRYLCKKLRAHDPDVPIVACNWQAAPESEVHFDKLRASGISQVETKLLQARDHLRSWLPVIAAENTGSDGSLQEARESDSEAAMHGTEIAKV